MMKKMMIALTLATTACCFGEASEEEHFLDREHVEQVWQKINVKIPEGHWHINHIPVAREVVDIVRPSRIIETGLNAGHSACLWLSLSEAELISVDIGQHACYGPTVKFLSEEFPGRFIGIKSDSKYAFPALEPYSSKVDLFFVDGDHSYEGALNDLEMAYRLRVPYILVDDTNAEATRKAINKLLKEDKMELVRAWDVGCGVELYRSRFTSILTPKQDERSVSRNKRAGTPSSPNSLKKHKSKHARSQKNR